MANERDVVLRSLDKDQARIARQERALLRDIVDSFMAARVALLDELQSAFSALGSQPTPAEIRRLANNVALIRAIEQRLAVLEREYGAILRDGLLSVSSDTFAAIASEVGILAAGAGVALFPFAIDPLLELTIAPALEQVPGLIASMRATILANVRESLAAGEPFGTIARSVFSAEGSIFSNGLTSAKLMARRAVIQANNNGRLIFLDRASESIPELKKQAVAKVSSARTTKVCLRVHGQIKAIGEPFDIVGEPSFGRRQQQPPFHWNCRTTVTGYLPQFDETSNTTTADMRRAARDELARREKDGT